MNDAAPNGPSAATLRSGSAATFDAIHRLPPFERAAERVSLRSRRVHQGQLPVLPDEVPARAEHSHWVHGEDGPACWGERQTATDAFHLQIGRLGSRVGRSNEDQL